MPESDIHKFVKNSLVEAFQKEGYSSKSEFRDKEGFIDVYAKKGDNEIKIEVYKSNIPPWVITKIDGDLQKKLDIKPNNKVRSQVYFEIDQEIYDAFRHYCIEHGLKKTKIIRNFMMDVVKNG